MPVAGVGVVALLAVAVPSRVNPQILVGESLRLQRLHAADHLFRGQPAPELVCEQPLARARTRRDVREVPAKEAAELVRAVLALGVVHHQNTARAQPLARLEAEPRPRKPRLDADPVRAVLEPGPPAARPADRDDCALSPLRHLEERRLLVGRPGADVPHLVHLCIGTEIARYRRELSRRHPVPHRIVVVRQAPVHRDDGTLARHGHVACELLRRRRQRHKKAAVTDLAQHRALLLGRVLEPEHPLDGAVLRILPRLDRHLQPRVHLHGLAAIHDPLPILERKRRPRHRRRTGVRNARNHHHEDSKWHFHIIARESSCLPRRSLGTRRRA